MHLALAAIPFVVLYAAVQLSNSLLQGLRRALVLGVPAVAAGLLVYAVSIRGSVGSGGRSFAQVERYSAELADFVSRDVRHGIESFAFLGWLMLLLALVGIVVMAQDRPRLALLTGSGTVIPLLLALGANLPLYEQLWRNLPGLRETRVPERFLPIACLCLAALVAFALARVPRIACVALLCLLVVDLRAGIELFHPSAADPDNRAYAARPQEAPLLELPVFLPDRQEGSVYLYYAIAGARTALRRLLDGRTAPGGRGAPLAPAVRVRWPDQGVPDRRDRPPRPLPRPCRVPRQAARHPAPPRLRRDRPRRRGDALPPRRVRRSIPIEW